MKRLFLVLPLCLLLLTGCKDPYGACVRAAADIETGIAQGMKTVDGLHTQGVISQAEDSKVLDYLEFASNGNKAFLACVTTAHNSGSKAGTFTACAQGFNTALNNPTELALVKVSNTSASQTVTTIINGLTTGVTAVVTALGGA